MNTIKEFTFVVICYNHSKYIIDSLESIKYIKLKYGQQIQIDLIISDDHSSDDTVAKVKKWRDENYFCFRRFIIYTNKQNIGAVQNIINALDMVKTKELKFLAGDDKFNGQDIFSIYENQMYFDNKKYIVITHEKLFGNVSSELQKTMNKRFRITKRLNDKKLLIPYLKYANCISAPAVFIPGSFLRDIGLKEFLSQFRNIEDYPMWVYLIIKHKIPVKFLDEQFVCYRIGSGISTSHDNDNSFSDETYEMYKKTGARCIKFPQYLNPYFYQSKLFRIIGRM